MMDSEAVDKKHGLWAMMLNHEMCWFLDLGHCESEFVMILELDQALEQYLLFQK